MTQEGREVKIGAKAQEKMTIGGNGLDTGRNVKPSRFPLLAGLRLMGLTDD